jgi:putative Flp pilus-assembly TadE/G-like protein
VGASPNVDFWGLRKSLPGGGRCRDKRECVLTKRNHEAGQALLIVALMLTVLIGVMGLAIDMGYLRYMKRKLQTAADAAALAGALDLSSYTTAADAASAENGFTDGQNGVVVTPNNPPTTAGDPHAGDPSYVEVFVSQPEPVQFARIFGVTSATLTTRAEAKITSGSNCVYALNTLAVALGTVDSSCGMVIEATLDCLGIITAPKIGVVGGSPCPGSSTIATPQPADPLAYLAAPAVGACGTTTASPYAGSSMQVTVPPLTVATFNPGVYCGGIQITGGTANFSPGTYILTSGGGGPGGLIVTAGVVTGTGVTFYNSGTGAINISVAVLNSVTLAAPTSQPYEGVLFFQDPSDTQNASFNISVAGSSLTGAYYFPDASIQFLGTVDFGQNAAYTILDAQNISFTLSLLFTIHNDYSSLPDGSPIKGGAVLVE